MLFLLLGLLSPISGATPEAIRQVHAIPQPPGVQPTDRYRVVVFVSGRCPCSRAHEKVLVALRRDFEPKGFRFFGVHSNADEPDFESSKLGFPVIEDRSGSWLNALGAVKTPHAYVIDNEGRIFYEGGVTSSHHPDAESEPWLRRALEALDAGKNVIKPQTRILGCAIKRAE